MKDNTYLVPAYKFILCIRNGAADRSDEYLDFDAVDGLTLDEIYSKVHRYFPIGYSNYYDRNY